MPLASRARAYWLRNYPMPARSMALDHRMMSFASRRISIISAVRIPFR
jgi:hypothetical protein